LEEEHIVALIGRSMFPLTSDDERVLKLADCIDGMLYAISERRLGNKNVDICYSRYLDYVVKAEIKNEVEAEVLNAVQYLWEKAIGH
jgi:hypothetical protein